jgi:phage terminase large subunit-like protein
MKESSSSKMDRQGKIAFIEALEEQERRYHDKLGERTYKGFYDWQRRFNAATKDHTACMLMAANQCVAGHTPIEVMQGKEVKSLRFADTLCEKDVSIRYWADGSLHDTDSYRAYFQGILPTIRLYLSNGEFLDCTGEHQLLDASGNYRTTRALMSGGDVRYCYQISEDSPASCVEGDYPHGQQPHQALGSDLTSLPLLTGALRHSHRSLTKDEVAQTDQYSQAFLSYDLLTSRDARDHVLALIDKFSSSLVLPSAQLLISLRRIFQQFRAGVVDPLLSAGEDDLSKASGYGEAYSNHIFFPSSDIHLANDVSIMSWQEIGFQPCFDYQIPDHHNYIAAGVVNHNCGKSQTGCCVDSIHLTGLYPDDWEGLKFDFAPRIWLLGYSGEKTRDLLQAKLFGRYLDGKFEGGYVPANLIVDSILMTGTKGAMREVRVKHPDGISVCQFWSYSQGQHALMGDILDWYHIDEEPKDAQIFPQVLTRTLNGNRGKGGSGILTFTPENGKTQLVCSFMGEDYEGDDEEEEIDRSGQYLQTATWDDAPHMTDEMKKKVLAMYPAYQRAMRSRGIPLMGSGLIYEHDETTLGQAPFRIPDYWFILNGMDFGWDHPLAFIQMVENRDTGEFYFVNAWKKSKKHPYQAWEAIKIWAEGIPTAWPHDGLKGQLKSSAAGGTGSDGETLKDMFIDAGFWMLDEHATWEDGGNSVQRGIMEFDKLMETGRFKIFNNLFEVFEEIRQYHTKTNASNGQTEIVKIKDDLLDGMRYAYMMRRYAIRVMDIMGADAEQFELDHIQDGRDSSTGY